MVPGLKSQIDRQKQYTLGRLKKTVSAKQHNRTRHSHKGRLQNIYTKASRQRANMASEQISAIQSMGPKVKLMMKQPTFTWGH